MSTINFSTLLLLRQLSPSDPIQSSTDQGLNWINIVWPLTVVNSDAPASIGTVALTSDLTITTINQYFVCGSSHLTFDGRRYQVVYNINPGANHTGLFFNGNSNSFPPIPGFSDITIRAFSFLEPVQNTQSIVGRNGFANAAVNNIMEDLVIVMSAVNNGVFVFGSAASNGGSLTIRRCSVKNLNPSFLKNADSLTGTRPAEFNGTLVIEQVWTDLNACPIVGDNAGSNNGQVVVRDCVALGTMGFGGGSGSTPTSSIAGSNFGLISNRPCSIERCYALGTFRFNGCVGIVSSIGPNASNVVVSACYYANNAVNPSLTNLQAICGNVLSNSNVVIRNCYGATDLLLPLAPPTAGLTIQNSYATTLATWSDTTASSTLLGAPAPSGNPIGSTWISTAPNTPYYLSSFRGSYIPDAASVAPEETFTSTPGIVPFPFSPITGSGYSFLSSVPGGNFLVRVDPTTGAITVQNRLGGAGTYRLTTLYSGEPRTNLGLGNGNGVPAAIYAFLSYTIDLQPFGLVSPSTYEALRLASKCQNIQKCGKA